VAKETAWVFDLGRFVLYKNHLEPQIDTDERRWLDLCAFKNAYKVLNAVKNLLLVIMFFVNTQLNFVCKGLGFIGEWVYILCQPEVRGKR
jgi:hypothetical protein